MCLMESMKGVWNGNVDLGDDQLNHLGMDYETHQQVFKDLSQKVGVYWKKVYRKELMNSN